MQRSRLDRNPYNKWRIVVVVWVCVYRSPSNDSTIDGRTQSTNAVINLNKKAYQRNHNLFIVGDFNYKDIDWCNDYALLEKQHLTDFIEVLQTCFLYQHGTEPTRYRENEKSNILNLILSREEGMVQDLTYHPPLGESDHVSLEFNVRFTQVKVEITPGRNVYKTNYGAIKAELKQVWEELLNSKFENDYDMFFEKLHTAMEMITPIKENSKSKKNIYMTNRATRLKNKKRRLWIRYLASKSRYDYIKCKNDLRELTKILRRDYEQELARIAKSKPKAFWKYAKSRLKTKPQIPSLSKPDGSKASTSKDKAETLNAYFCSVFTVENIQNIPEITSCAVLQTIKITPVVVRNKLHDLNPNKSPGPDQWHPYFLKELADCIYIPLSILFNMSLKDL